MSATPDVAAVFLERTGQSFASRTLLEQALTHDSCGGDAGRDFERMEFLGDACIDLYVALILVQETRMTEGEMHLARSALTRNDALAAILRSWGVEGHFRLGRSVDRRNLPDIVYADFFESLVGALFLDRGAGAVEALVRRVFRPGIDDLLARGGEVASPKNRLQEIFMARGEAMPAYATTGKSGPSHAPVYTVEVRLADDTRFTASGSSVRQAEQRAAQAALEGLTT